MWASVPDGIKLAGGIIGIVITLGGGAFALANSAIRAHEQTFLNEGYIQQISDTTVVMHAGIHAVQNDLTEVKDVLEYQSCLTRLELSDSIFSAFQVNERCPR